MGKVAYIMADKTGDFVNSLLAHHGPALRKYLTRTLKSAQDAADVMQEASLRLLRLARPDDIKAPRAYLFSTALKITSDWMRLRKGLSLVPLGRESDQVSEDRPSLEQGLIERDALQRLKTIAAELPEKRREIFARHYFDHQPRPEIAAALGISRITVDQQLRLGLEYCERRWHELNAD
jgi:RNA polymerase sigma factor, sigma-70 family